MLHHVALYVFCLDKVHFWLVGWVFFKLLFANLILFDTSFDTFIRIRMIIFCYLARSLMILQNFYVTFVVFSPTLSLDSSTV